MNGKWKKNQVLVIVVLTVGLFGANVGHGQWRFSGDEGGGSFSYTAEPVGEDFDQGFNGETVFAVSSTEFHYSLKKPSSEWHFSNAFHKDEAHFQIGWSAEKTAFYGFSGYGKTLAKSSHRYSDLDPFIFHGGNNQRFDFSGLAVAKPVTNQTTLNLAYTNIKSELLDDRSVFEFSVSGKHYKAAFAQVDRGGQRVGTALSLTAGTGKHQFNADYLKQKNGASLKQLSYHTRRGDKRYEVSLQSVENPLYDIKNENRVVFSLGFDLGGNKRFHAAEEESGKEVKGRKNTYLFGAIGIGLGLGLSSGSESGDDASRLESQHAVAKQILNEINPVSVSLNREHGGYIYRNADGSFAATDPILGNTNSVSLPNPIYVTPPGVSTTASYHTHGAFDPRYENEIFSDVDVLSNIRLRLDGYLGTPGGQFKFHDYATGEIQTLGTIATR